MPDISFAIGIYTCMYVYKVYVWSSNGTIYMYMGPHSLSLHKPDPASLTRVKVTDAIDVEWYVMVGTTGIIRGP